MANTISSRTPEGTPNRCPLCGAAICVEPTQPPGDAPCPNCGTLLWFTKTPDGLLFFNDETVRPILEKLVQIICDNLGVNKETVRLAQSFTEDLGTDSLDMVEMMMELEEEFEIQIPDEDAERIRTVRDLVIYMLRRGF